MKDLNKAGHGWGVGEAGQGVVEGGRQGGGEGEGKEDKEEEKVEVGK